MRSENRSYTEQEVEQILRLASGKVQSGGMSRAQLLAVAAEAGLNPEAVAAAEEEYFANRDEAEDLAAYRRKTIKEFYEHLGTYAVIVGGLTAFDLLRDGNLNWAYWPIIGWGIAVLIHAVAVFFTDTKADKDFQRWRRKKNRDVSATPALARDVEETIDEIADDLDLDDEDDEEKAIKQIRSRLNMTRREAKEALEHYQDANS